MSQAYKQLLCANSEFRLSVRGLGSRVTNMTNSQAEASRGCRESMQIVEVCTSDF